jgi:hypothetical protein
MATNSYPHPKELPAETPAGADPFTSSGGSLIHFEDINQMTTN